ncbi:MAG: M1 family metallopeptidase [Bacteroidota bacterium]|nr:M1 family metallopeptidase [Bacteroidota bacterium]
MKKIFLSGFFYFLLSVTFAQSKYFQQQVNYSIDVTLNDIENTLDGFEIINYTNNSPDTLHYIWFHLWPNAYKNDRTAFSEQLLQLGRTDFYFSDEAKRGYINRLDFKVNGTTANLEDDSLYIDVAKLILPAPLLSGETIKISTPFHEKIPFNFSRGGHVDHSYQITQWYPKPAVYDTKGWHPMPYLDQGEFYSEFGNYEVHITVPKNYIVAATGELQNKDEETRLKEKATGNQQSAISNRQLINGKEDDLHKGKKKVKKKYQPSHKKIKPINKKSISNLLPDTSKLIPEKTKTLIYKQKDIHDFAWFADKNFTVRNDTLQLASGKIINAWSFFLPADSVIWRNSIEFIKDAIKTRSKWLGEYPYNTVTAVEAKMGFSGGMEYPTITSISPMPDQQSLDMTIEHEVGHNWVYGILATNERDHPWMDEGMNTYFDNRYKKLKYPKIEQKEDFLEKRIPADDEDIEYRTQLAAKKDQPIETPSQDFSETNYDVIAYYKTGLWMKKLEDFVGKNVFDSCLHQYYNLWKFKHPYPEDFEKVVENLSGKNMNTIFSLLNKKGRLEPPPKKEFKVASFFNFKNTDKYNYLFLSPAAGYNFYDKLMLGALVHNYTLPEPKFHFFVAPLYATGSKTLNGIARAGYDIMSYGWIRKAEISLSAEKFSMDEFTDSTGAKNYLDFSKIVPSVKFIFKNKKATSTIKKWVQWKTYFIRETALSFQRDTLLQKDIITYPKINRYLNQLNFTIEDNRALYPYSSNVVLQQANNFLRFSFEGKYFFNYPKGGGMNARLFAGKFVYLSARTIYKQFATDRYHLNLTGANGYEDYTYSNYFVGRNEFEGAPSQQIMIRDGGFKVRSDLLSSKIGKTDNWLAALNLTSDFPKQMNPFQVFNAANPLKIFFDVGTYAEAWKKDAVTGKFLYDAGLQICLYKNLVNVYIPVLYSKIYSDYYKSTLGNKRFWKTISFSIDIQNFRLDKFINLPDL